MKTETTGGSEAYEARAKALWGGTAAYREYEERTAGKSRDAARQAGEGLMEIFASFGALRETGASGPAAQKLVADLRDYITAHFYTCTDEILAGLGKLYASDGEFTANIDRAGGAGTASFAAEAIAFFCGRRANPDGDIASETKK